MCIDEDIVNKGAREFEKAAFYLKKHGTEDILL